MITQLAKLSLFVLLSITAYATDITGCTTITSGGSYTVPANTAVGSSSDYTCLEIAASGAVDITCESGATITALYQPLYIHDSTSYISLTGCVFISTNTAASWMNIDCNGHALYMDHLTVGLGYHQMSIGNCTYPYFTYNTFYASMSLGATSPVILYNTFDLSGATDTVAGMLSVGGSNPDVESNYFLGTSSYVDDGIVYNNLMGGYFYGNTITGVFDACIEQTGYSTNTYIQGNNCSVASYTMFGCYSNFGCSISGMNFSTNTLSGSGPVYMIALGGDGGSVVDSYFLTNTNNTSGGAAFGGYTSGGTHFSTVSGNYLYGNSFGGPVYFDYGSSSGWSDGGANYCTSATPAAITCH